MKFLATLVAGVLFFLGEGEAFVGTAALTRAAGATGARHRRTGADLKMVSVHLDSRATAHFPAVIRALHPVHGRRDSLPI